MKFTDFETSYNYLLNHPMFCDKFLNCLDISVVKVNPKTKRIEDDKKLNTLTQVWLECGPFVDEIPTHDIDLDCGGETFEDAIIELANLVYKHYSDDIDKISKRIKKKYL